MRSAIAVLLAFLVVGVAGCGGGGTTNLPAGPDLLQRSAQAMREVTSAHVSVRVDPGLTSISLRQADADVTRDAAKGTAQLTPGGQPMEIQFVMVGSSLYLKGPTGEFQKLPAGAASSVYDPTSILDPDRGVAKLLATASDARTEARQQVNGQDAYKVHATFDPQVLSALVPGLTGQQSGELWIGAATSQLLQADVDVPARQGQPAGTVHVVLSNLNQPVTITPPQ